MTDTATITTEVPRRTKLVLPDEVQATFDRITSVEVRNEYARVLRAKGWTLASIANSVELSRERVRQIIEEENPEHPPVDEFPLPEVPTRKTKAKPVYVEPSAEGLKGLLDLMPEANSNSPKYADERRQFTERLNALHVEEGVPLYRIALRLGVTSSGLRSRLVRYGYLQSTGTSKAYNTLKVED